MRPFIATKKFNILGRNVAGVSFIETLIALALLGLIAVAFLSGLFTASKATFIIDEQATAESLARSQMEYVKSQGYIDYEEPGHEEYLVTTPAGYAGYIIEEINVEPLPDPNGGTLDGIQKITVTILRDGEDILTVKGYKVDR